MKEEKVCTPPTTAVLAPGPWPHRNIDTGQGMHATHSQGTARHQPPDPAGSACLHIFCAPRQHRGMSTVQDMQAMHPAKRQPTISNGTMPSTEPYGRLTL
jgi:hypothetical protein